MKVVVTGASEGIGGATCLRFAETCAARGDGLKLVMTTSGRKPPPAGLHARLAELGAECLALTGDLADPATCEDVARRTLEFCGGLDAFVSNAGAMGPGPLASLPLEDWDRLFAVNVRPTLLLAQAFRTALAESRGSIVAVASMAGIAPHRGSGSYSTSKAAQIMLCRQLAQEWAGEGIRVNAVAPGMIATPLTERVYANAEVKARREAVVPLGRIGTPEDIAGAIVFLAGPEAAYVTGQVLLADGGFVSSIMGTIPALPQT